MTALRQKKPSIGFREPNNHRDFKLQQSSRFEGRGGSFFAIYLSRSRLYRGRILRPNIHFSAFFKIYKIHIPLHRSIFKICRIFRIFRLKNDEFSRFLQIFGETSPTRRGAARRRTAQGAWSWAACEGESLLHMLKPLLKSVNWV